MNRLRSVAPGVLVLVVALGVLVATPVAVLAFGDYSDMVEQLDAVEVADGHVEAADRWLHLSAALAAESAATSAKLLSDRVVALQSLLTVDYDASVRSARAASNEWLTQASTFHETDHEGSLLAEELAVDLERLRADIDSGGIGHRDAVLGMFDLAHAAGNEAEMHITALISHASAVNAGGQLASGARIAQGATVMSVQMSEALATWGVLAFPPERPKLPEVSGLSHAIVLLEDSIEDFESTLVPGTAYAAEWEATKAALQPELALDVMRSTLQRILQTVIDEQSFPDPSEITPQVLDELQQFDDPFATFIDIEGGLFALSLEATEVVEDANDDLRAEARTRQTRVIGIIGILLAVGALTIAGAIWLVVRPLRRLAAVLSRAGEGDLSARAPAVGIREVRKAAATFNQALSALEQVEQKAIAIAEERYDDEVMSAATPGRLGASLDAAVDRLTSSLAEREDFRRRLAYESSHDTLTMLPNRRSIFESLRSALARTERGDSRVALVHIDLDGFKSINDQFGHGVGDRYLRTVAQRLGMTIRPGDVAGRIGGDEFVVILEPVADQAEATFCVDRIQAALSEPFTAGGVSVPTGASIGWSSSAGDLTPDDLFHRSDLALYRAKERGRGSVVMCDDELLRTADERVQLDTAISRGLEANEFQLHYQPIVDAESGRTVSLEALVRWNRPGHGMVSPGLFIPHAERSDLIIDLDRWVLRAAVSQALVWNQNPELANVPISVNFSGRHLSSGKLADHVLACIGDAGLDPKRIVVEMTESALVDDLETASREWARLRAAGVRVALDDFGTGFMSLAVLRSLQADTLKIDQSFVARVDEPTERSLVELMVQTGHLLGAVIVAEGVETAAQRAALIELGSERLQGYFFARPMPAADIESRAQRVGV